MLLLGVICIATVLLSEARHYQWHTGVKHGLHNHRWLLQIRATISHTAPMNDTIWGHAFQFTLGLSDHRYALDASFTRRIGDFRQMFLNLTAYLGRVGDRSPKNPWHKSFLNVLNNCGRLFVWNDIGLQAYIITYSSLCTTTRTHRRRPLQSKSCHVKLNLRYQGC